MNNTNDIDITKFSKERKYWMDLARIIASFFVIIIHLTADESGANLIIKVLLHCAVPIFIMISGTNFLNPYRELSIKKMWKEYIFPLFVTFLVWSIIYAIYNSYIYFQNDYIEMLKNIIINTINGHYHLWYIWMIIAMYAVTVFIKKITDNSNNMELLYYLLLAYSYLSLKYLIQFHPFSLFDSAVTDMRLTFVSGFLIYFIGGQYLSRLDYKKMTSIIMLVIAIVCCACNFAIAMLDIHPLTDGDRFGYFSPFNIGFSFSCYWFLSRYTETFAKKHKRIIVKISSLTLSIYMSHVLVIEFVKYVFSIEKINTVLFIPIGIIVFIICCVIALTFNLTSFTSLLFNGKPRQK